MATEEAIRILVAGDCAPIGPVESAFRNGRRSFFSTHTRASLRSKDLSLVNLEVPLTGRSAAVAKVGPSLKADPATVSILKEAAFDIACLANNHIRDHGDSGLLDTLAACHEQGIRTVGAGLTSADAGRPLNCDVRGRRIAILNFAEHEFSYATADHGGANPLDPVESARQVRAAAAAAQHVLVIVHGGHEGFQYPSRRMINLYRFFIEQGADAVIGHHSHCAGPCEPWGNGFIAYGLGNFLFPWRAPSKRWLRGYMAALTLAPGRRTGCEILPYDQCADESLEVALLTGTRHDEALQDMEEMTRTLHDEAKLLEEWKQLQEKSYRGRLCLLAGIDRRIGRVLQALGLLEAAMPKKRLLRILNMIECEAHFDLTVASLRKLLGAEQRFGSQHGTAPDAGCRQEGRPPQNRGDLASQ